MIALFFLTAGVLIGVSATAWYGMNEVERNARRRHLTREWIEDFAGERAPTKRLSDTLAGCLFLQALLSGGR